ncbi:hypothetical protein PFTANZ_06040 [Plasmodium falciparum Tanzania (2000708)]|uniref:Surface antigen n=1 Tax=Plasmodium falciparum Tanzania (2000708) TaxID=1036725 RepID=A0A024VYA0_PLAFA|nr:hypothetical protein PFTANZ_06040 [Plasmodium falciparum Tanzania (2000708)]
MSLDTSITVPAACSQFQINFGIHLRIGNTINRYGTPDTIAIPKRLGVLLGDATKTAKAAEAAKSAKLTAEITEKQTALIEAGFNTQIMDITKALFFSEAKLPTITVTQMLSSGNFTNNVTLFDMIQHINNTMYDTLESKGYSQFCNSVSSIVARRTSTTFNKLYTTQSEAVTKAVAEGKAAEGLKLATNTSILNNTIIASVVAIVVIVLVMVIIYLILRYRRKKKMKKKLQYMKLLKE